MKTLQRVHPVLIITTAIAFLVAIWAVFLYAPTERTMGEVQRIFYFHVPSAWIAFLAFFVVFGTSIAFLANGRKIFDDIAYASAEIGIFFTTLVLLTGPLWARPIWNTWWTWDARLTTTLILWLIYIAYMMLRAFIADRERSARLAAVFGIVGFIDVPIVYMSIRWWRTLHPAPVMGGGAGSGLATPMLQTLLIALLAFTLLFLVLLSLRVQVAILQEKVAALEETLNR